MAYDQILILTKLIANLGQIKNWGVSFVVKHMYLDCGNAYTINYRALRCASSQDCVLFHSNTMNCKQ